MKTAIARLLACLYAAGGFLLPALMLCAPHLALAQPFNAISIVAGNNQSGDTYNELPTQLTVAFSNTQLVTKLEWTITNGAIGGSADFQENDSNDYIDPNYNGTQPTPGQTAGVRLDLDGTPGPVVVKVTCTGCDDGSGTGTQTLTFNETVIQSPPFLEMDILSGNGQTGAPNSTLPQPLTVQLTDQPGFDGPFDVPLQWTIASGSASFTANHGQSYSQTVSLPAPSGRAAKAKSLMTSGVSIDMGPTPGPVVVNVSCIECDFGSSRVFRLTNAATSSSASLQKISGDNQSGVIGSASDAPLVVQLGASGGSSLSGQTVSWAVISGQATLSAASSLTDTNGQASISFSYGTTPGPVTIEASASNGKVDFSATAVNATASIVSGNNQIGVTGGTLQPFVIQIAEAGAASKGLSQVAVSWAVTSGGGTLTSTTTTTDATGKSSNLLTLGSNPGANTVTATLQGMSPIILSFNATAIVGSISAVSGDSQTAIAGSALQPFVVQVGSNGQGAPGINVNWSIVQGGGALAAATTVTDTSGKAINTLTLGPNPGLNIVRASISGMGSVSFSANATAVAAENSQFTIVSGNSQALIPGTASQPLIVKLLTSQGQPVSGVNVLWSVSGSSGKLATPNSLTDASGQAQNQLTVVLPGSYTVTAQLANTPAVPALNFGFNNGVANLPSLSPTQTSVAHAIDKACPALASMSGSQLTSAQQDLLQRCSEVVVASGSDPQQVPNALSQMVNNKALPQSQLANGVQLSQFGNLNTRLAELRQGAQGVSIAGLTLTDDGRSLPLATLGDAFRKDPKQSNDGDVGTDFDRWGFFATGMVERGGFDSDTMRPGFDFHNASLTAGADYRFTDAFVAGLALGYNTSDSSLDQNQGKVDVNSYSLNGYFTWYHNNDFYVEGSVVLDWLNYDLSRNIIYQIASLSGSGSTSINQSTSASPDGHQTSLSLSIGKDFNRGAWAFSPYLRGVYSHVSLDGFSETVDDPNNPGSGLGTSVDSRSLTSELGVLGTRLSYTTSFDWGVLVPNAMVEWNHEFRNDPQTIVTRFLADPTQTPIVITDTPTDQNYFNLGLGVNAVLPKGRSGYFLWEHLVGFAGAHENRYSLGVRIEF